MMMKAKEVAAAVAAVARAAAGSLRVPMAAPAAKASLQVPAEALNVAQEARQWAEGLTRGELIAAIVVASEGREEAEQMIEDLRDDIAVLDAALSQHPAAVEQYNQLLFNA